MSARQMVLAALAAATAGAQRTPYDYRWDVASGDGRFATHGNNEALVVRRGMLVAPELRFGDETVDFDVRGEPNTFAGFAFRMQSNADYDVIYMVTDSIGRWREVQYQGVYQGETSWQLYPGPGYRAEIPAASTRGGWAHVRIVLRGEQASVWVGSAARPVLTVPGVKRDIAPGYVGLWSEGDARSEAQFAGLRVDSAPVAALPEAAEPPIDPAAIRRWQVTGRLAAPDSASGLRDLPAGVMADASQWRDAPTEADGLVNLTREIGNASGAQQYNVFGGGAWGMALARTTIVAPAAGTRRLELGYSDQVSVFLDGRLIFRGDNSYATRGSDLGRVSYDNASVEVPLTAGTHQLVLAVSDHQFGWGFKARWAPPD